MVSKGIALGCGGNGDDGERKARALRHLAAGEYRDARDQIRHIAYHTNNGSPPEADPILKAYEFVAVSELGYLRMMTRIKLEENEFGAALIYCEAVYIKSLEP